MPPAADLADTAFVLLALAAGVLVAVLTARSFRRAARATSRDVLRIVLDPAAVAERMESEFTTMLVNGEVSQAQYRALVGALAEDSASVRRPAPSTGTDQRRAS